MSHWRPAPTDLIFFGKTLDLLTDVVRFYVPYKIFKIIEDPATVLEDTII